MYSLRQLSVLPAALVLLTSCASGVRLSPEQIRARAHYDRAQDLVADERWEQAIETLDSALALDSTHAGAYALRGAVKHRTEYPVSESLADLDRSLQIRGSYDTFLSRALVRQAAGMLDSALADCDEAILYAEAKGFDSNLVRAQRAEGKNVVIDLGPELNAQYAAMRQRALALRERILSDMGRQ